MIHIAVEFSNQKAVRACVTNSASELGEFLRTAAKVKSNPPKRGKATVIWDRHSDDPLPPGFFPALRNLFAEIPISGNLKNLVEYES